MPKNHAVPWPLGSHWTVGNERGVFFFEPVSPKIPKLEINVVFSGERKLGANVYNNSVHQAVYIKVTIIPKDLPKPKT